MLIAEFLAKKSTKMAKFFSQNFKEKLNYFYAKNLRLFFLYLSLMNLTGQQLENFMWQDAESWWIMDYFDELY